MENNIRGIQHIALHASDFEKSYKFYTEGLGFKEYRRWKSGERTICLLEIGNGQYIELFSCGKERTTEEEQSGMYVHLALDVADSKKAFARAVEFGAEPKKEPTRMDLPSQPPIPVILSFVYGPDREQIEFFQVL